MNLRKEVHKPNDVSAKYLRVTEAERLFDYFKLPGKFVRSYPTKIVKRDGSEREMDWLILVDPDGETIRERTLINVEFQTKRVDEKKIEAVADYRDYSKTYFGLPVLSVIVIFDYSEYGPSLKDHKTTASDILKPIYICMPWEEIEKRLNNLESKIVSKKELSEDEAFDIAFLPIFAPEQKAKSVTEKITRLYHKDKTIKGALRNDVAYVLGIMIRKHFDFTAKRKELLKLIEKEINKTELMDVIEYELNYRDQAHQAEIEAKNEEIIAKDKELSAKDEEIIAKDEENAKLKAKLAENGISY